MALRPLNQPGNNWVWVKIPATPPAAPVLGAIRGDKKDQQSDGSSHPRFEASKAKLQEKWSSVVLTLW